MLRGNLINPGLPTNLVNTSSGFSDKKIINTVSDRISDKLMNYIAFDIYSKPYLDSEKMMMN